MAKTRVYELARDLKLESKALVLRLKDLGIEVASHQSTLTGQQIEKVKASLAANDKPKVVVRRRRRDEDQPAAVVEEPVLETAAVEETLSVKAEPEKVVMQEQVQEQVKAKVPEPEVLVKSQPKASETVEVAQTLAPEGSEEADDADETEKKRKFNQEQRAKLLNLDAPVAKVVVAEPVEAPRKPAPPEGQRRVRMSSTFSGAKIVRRATPEEIQEAKASEEARSRAPRREDSRGTRVTGSGVSPRSNEGRPPERPQERRDRPPARRDGPPVARPKSPEFPAPLPLEFGLEPGGGKWTRRTGEFKPKTKEEEERAPARAIVPAVKRRLNARDLLAVTTSEDEDEVEAPIAVRRKRTVYTPAASKKREARKRKDFRQTEITMPRASYRVVKLSSDTITVRDLAIELSVKAGDVIKKLMAQGVMVTMNQHIDFDTAVLIGGEYGFEVVNVSKSIDDLLISSHNGSESQGVRPPIITVMGHVDHGKTSLLDAIRQTDIVAGESGGITQHIGAYMVEKDGFKFSFLDTPGHAAFSAMRARGAKLTDIVVLVVAADDGVMPQTVEAITHAKEAGVPIIVAINKIDKPGVNLDRLFSELSEHGIQSEEWGGENQFVRTSAIKKEGIAELLEAIHLQAEILELSTSLTGPGQGVVVEAHMDKGRGPVATVILTTGTLEVGDQVVVGSMIGRVRSMTDYHGVRVEIATPSLPVEVVGLTSVPMSGDPVNVIADDKLAKEIAAARTKNMVGSIAAAPAMAATLEELIERARNQEVPQVPLMIKGDTQGTVEAIISALNKLNCDRVRNIIVHQGIGGINNCDLDMASASGAMIVGFNVKAGTGLDDLAERRDVKISYFSIIYELIDMVKQVMASKLPPICTEHVIGHAEIRDAINVPKIGLIAGSAVLDGKMVRNAHLRLMRDREVIFQGRIGSLRRFKDDVKEVTHGYECGISFDGYSDIKIGDIIEAFTIEQTPATLDV